MIFNAKRFLIIIALFSMIGSLDTAAAERQSPTPAPITSLVTLTTRDLSGKVLQTISGVSLGHGIVLTYWHAITLQGLYATDHPDLFVSPRHRLASYSPTQRDYDHLALTFALCTDSAGGLNWQPNASAPQACLPFDLSALTTVTPNGESQAVGTHLLYANQASDVALLALSADLPGSVTSARLSNTLDSAEPVWIATTPGQAPATDAVDSTALPDGAALKGSEPGNGFVFDQTTGALIGLIPNAPRRLAGRSLSAVRQWINPIYAAFAGQKSPVLQVLNEAQIGAVAGGQSIGDAFTPTLGNTGYHVSHYDLDLKFDLNSGVMSGTATLDMVATFEQLASLTLDFSVMQASRVTVDGALVRFLQRESDQKLAVTLPHPVAFGTPFKVAVTYAGNPAPIDSAYLHFLPTGMTVDTNTHRLFVVNEPDAAHTWFPGNDHPRDRSTYTYHITVDQALTAVANGTQQGDPVSNPDGTHTFIWDMPYPMATYLTVISIADYTSKALPSPAGIPLAVYAYQSDIDLAFNAFFQTGDLLQQEIGHFGKFPFASYGQVLVPQDAVGMEAQTMTVMPDNNARQSPKQIYTFIGHEMAHQWFGDAVGLSNWAEIWLNEGFASYAEYLALEARDGKQGARTLLDSWERNITSEKRTSALINPTPAETFGTNSVSEGRIYFAYAASKNRRRRFFQDSANLRRTLPGYSRHERRFLGNRRRCQRPGFERIFHGVGVRRRYSAPGYLLDTARRARFGADLPAFGETVYRIAARRVGLAFQRDARDDHRSSR